MIAPEVLDPRATEPDPRGPTRPPTVSHGAAAARWTVEKHVARAGIAVTAVAFCFFAAEMAALMRRASAAGSVGGMVEAIVFLATIAFLVYGNLVYQVARLGYIHRRSVHRPTDEDVSTAGDAAGKLLCVLVPSYKEEPRVVRQALLSAALQEYPNRRVVLLVDDPPEPLAAADRGLLERARALPTEIEQLLSGPARRFRRAMERAKARGFGDLRRERTRLASLYRDAAEWFAQLGLAEQDGDHTDELFVDKVLLTRSRALARVADSLTPARAAEWDAGALTRAYERLVAQFNVRLTSFERKRYVNLSHEANKAMNLNAYIALLGGRWVEVERPDGVHLEPAGDRRPDLDLADPAYLITLDADSILAAGYANRLCRHLEAPGNERVAVVQTPYSAVPGAPGALERTAGATTDMQYIVHQGFTRHAATFWVGANALIRKAALEDIAVEGSERGYRITRYIQDRTVIEDTESSVDLVSKGWTLVNYPERLSYSATPPDFGALVIQRRRWANGGLLIVPKLLRGAFTRHAAGRPRLGETLMRMHYLTSIAGANLALVVLMTWPFGKAFASVWLPLTALPYYVSYARDLRKAGYRFVDVLHVYALNLVLLPVNLGGVARSLVQAILRRKSPFVRTPKVEDRTRAPAVYLLALLALLAAWIVGVVYDATHGRWAHGAFGGVNALLLVFAIRGFIGWRHLFDDIAAGLGRFRGRRSVAGVPATA